MELSTITYSFDSLVELNQILSLITYIIISNNECMFVCVYACICVCVLVWGEREKIMQI